MTGLGRRLSQERDLWRSVWQHVDAFLDRINSAKDNDQTHATTMCVLFDVFAVIERARKRSAGYGLLPALWAVPGGVNSDGTTVHVNAGALGGAAGRIPGTEECEFACASYRVNTDDDGKTTLDDIPWAFMSRTIVLAKFRDAKHGEVSLRTPTYDFGALDGDPMIAINIGDGGLFPQDYRKDAINGGYKLPDGTTIPARFNKWSELRAHRLDALASPTSGDKPVPLSQKIVTLESPISQAALNGIAQTANGFADELQGDIDKLNKAKQTLSAAGIGDDVVGALAAATQAMTDQIAAFHAAHDAIYNHGVPGPSTLTTWSGLLAKAEGTLAWPSRLPAALNTLDGKAAAAMDEAVENRIGYPDGPLRQLRMLQWTLRFFWEHRRGWMNWRHGLVLSRLYRAYFDPFVNSLYQVMHGGHSGLIYPGNAGGAASVVLPANTMVGKQTLIGATELPLSNTPDLTLLQAGRIAVVAGDRPTAAPVIDGLTDWKKLPPVRFKVPQLAVSVDGGAGMPGTPGLIEVGTKIQDHYDRAFSDDEWYRGAHAPGLAGDGKPARARDGIVHGLIAHRSRLALVLGNAGGDDRPAPPAMARPYASIAKFALEGKITPSDNRLFLTALPAANKSGTGEQLPLAAPGEFLLLCGWQSGELWQTAIEVDRCVIVTGSEAKRDDGSGAPPTPACCADDDPVMVFYLRQMYLPADVTELTGAFLHRSFAGFGARSMLTRVMLPEDLDPSTSSTVTVGPEVIRPRRDPELEVAWRISDEWFPKETR